MLALFALYVIIPISYRLGRVEEVRAKHELCVRKSSFISSWHISCYLDGTFLILLADSVLRENRTRMTRIGRVSWVNRTFWGKMTVICATKGFGQMNGTRPYKSAYGHDIGHDMSCLYVINHRLFGDQTILTSWQHVLLNSPAVSFLSRRFPDEDFML